MSLSCVLFPAHLFPIDSPKSFWWYHLMCWLLSAVGVICILVAHEHYTVDVVVAYFVTSRLFWWYHTMANVQVRLPTVSHPVSMAASHRLDRKQRLMVTEPPFLCNDGLK